MLVNGSIYMPGDKSISHRALMLSSLSSGDCVIHNISTGEDVQTTRNCLLKCGIYSEIKKDKIIIKGGTFSLNRPELYCGNSGTTIRLLLGLLAGQGVSALFTGDESLSNRPMDRIINPLSKMGIVFESNNGYLPIKMIPGKLKGIDYTLPVPSAQVKSSILLAGLGAEGNTSIHESIETRDHTEIMLDHLGVDIDINTAVSVSKLNFPLKCFNLSVPGDPSSAAFFAVLAAILPNSDILIKNILANPTRIGVFDVMKKMGVGIEWQNLHSECGELVGDLHVYSQPIHGVDITKKMVPSLIDELPIIAVLASQADSPTSVSGASELRIKESDRISTICLNLSNMGCEIIEKHDGFIINPVNKLYNTNIKTFGDHRIAMAFTIAGYVTEKVNSLDDAKCINISFPEFSKILNSIIK